MITIIKKAVSFLLVIFLMIGACGCMWKKTEIDANENIVNNMVRYMNDKYADDTFVYKCPFGGGAGAYTKTIIVSSKKYPDKDIYVRYSFNDGDNYSDNYLGVKYASQTELAIKRVLDSIISYDYLLFYEADRFACPNGSGTLSFEKYVANDASCIGFTVVVNGSVLNKDIFESKIKDAILNSGICCSATIYFDNSSDAFATLKTDGLSGYTFKKLYSDVFYFEMNSIKEVSASRWGD